MSPAEVMERLKALPEHLQPSNRRFIVEAVTDETRAPLVEYYRAQTEAENAAQIWAKTQGADGFYPPGQGWGGHGGVVSAFSFKKENAPTGAAWVAAGRGYVDRHGYVAMRLSKRPAGRALAAEIDLLPKFPGQRDAIAHLGHVTDLNTATGNGSVGHSDGKLHFTVPSRVEDRFFVSVVNHNFDIFAKVERAISYLESDTPQYADKLDFKDDPIAWRPGAGWQLLTKSEFEFLAAEARLRIEQASRAKSEAA
jgi:hypothetical protein